MQQRLIATIFTAALFTSVANFTQVTALAQNEADRVATKSAVLKEGTEIPLRFGEGLNSKTATGGDPVHLVLAQDIVVDGVTLARAGSPVTAEVTNAKKAGMMGKGGELNIRLDHLSAGTTKVRLRGTKSREGDGKVGTAVALTVLFGPVGLLKHGKNIEIAEGTPLTGYVAESVSLPVAR